jgi:pyrimidine-nucleoside phosphorylase
VLESVAHLLALSDLGVDEQEGRRRAEEAVASGAAFTAYERWIEAQGGDPDLDVLPRAPVVREVTAVGPGVVRSLGAIRIGKAALHLGAGRQTKTDSIDHSVGVVCRKKRGDAVDAGEMLAEIHARDAAAAERAESEVLGAYEVTDEAPGQTPIVLDVLT